MAQDICETYLIRSKDNNYSGAYFGNTNPKNRQIHIRRMNFSFEPDRELMFFDHPVWVWDAKVLICELCTLTHEIGHAENHLINDYRYADYKLSLIAWMNHYTKANAVPRPPFTEHDRGRIYEEESMAEERSRDLIKMLIPDILPECDSRIYENLNSYQHILWTNRYPNGREHNWSEDRYKNVVLESRKKADDGTV